MSEISAENIIESIQSQTVRLLSRTKNSEFYVTPANNAKIALVQIGTQKRYVIFIAKSYQLDNFVLSYRDRVERNHTHVSVIYCDVAKIREINNVSMLYEDDDSDEESTSQRNVLRILRDAGRLQSSDVHFVVSKGIGRVRFRVNGSLIEWNQLSEQETMAICATIYQSMSDVAEPTFRSTQAQRSRMKESFLRDIGLTGARVNTRPLESGFLMVLRLFYAETSIRPSELSDLGYLQSQCDDLEHLRKFRAGIVLISGATGSGKSTTLKLIMEKQLSDDSGIHVLTLEDPPEYVIKDANQSPVSGDRSNANDVEQAWSQAIADAMRLDPDVIMIGEVRDAVSAKMAFRAAMTGHLVWTTIHANTAMTILYRLEDEGVNPSLLTDENILIGLVNQSLVPTLCPHCKIPYCGHEVRLDKGMRQRLEAVCSPEKVYLEGNGCEHCRQTGIAGRTVVAEIIRTSEKFMSVYREQGYSAANKYWLNEMNGMRKMDAAIIKIACGEVSPCSVERILGPINEAIRTGIS
ncbi:type ii secretion system protein [Salmonella enterica]|uniref:GspE/PulE family protein n=1 Tax=Salmonella enterica TaxID=28901 RepID=UPI00126EEFC8|nr:ATPase, T2SS/T4P/T4SS family [Salmonella enterica]EDS4242091.1 type ii secretion system protein [Salmonella enterica subsp. enterica]HEC9488000.1 Flp pilus assembly complex ATPase component TadA [Salmonella enterica subsp. enterica serovar Orientalis]EAS1948224.1 type ii secretion system protein [Salmonella enterica]EAX1287063.1 type ii secretion system protein [Salmonella enterica]EAX2834724.1 type ii secretion system protein [Salmonella enterica]